MSDKFDRLAAYHAEYAAAVGTAMAGWSAAWFEAEFPVAEATAWASAGFRPSEGEQLAALGLTPGQARAIWDSADTIEEVVPGLTADEMAQRIQVIAELKRVGQ